MDSAPGGSWSGVWQLEQFTSMLLYIVVVVRCFFMDISGLLMEMCSNLSAREKLAIRNSPNNKMAGHRHRYEIGRAHV